jgi:hypothetical protein
LKQFKKTKMLYDLMGKIHKVPIVQTVAWVCIHRAFSGQFSGLQLFLPHHSGKGACDVSESPNGLISLRKNNDYRLK